MVKHHGISGSSFMQKTLNRILRNIRTHDNNQLLLRYVLAFLVYFSHLHAAYGLPEPTIIFHSIGWYAVNCFFILSGILVTQSYTRSTVIQYFLKEH